MRTTGDKVKEIMETTLQEFEIEPYIVSANALVENALTGKGLPNILLAEIERWLTAHMIAMTRDRVTKREEAGTAKVEYAGEWKMSFDATSYGQMAMSLDISGTLRNLMSKKIASIKAVPTP